MSSLLVGNILPEGQLRRRKAPHLKMILRTSCWGQFTWVNFGEKSFQTLISYPLHFHGSPSHWQVFRERGMQTKHSVSMILWHFSSIWWSSTTVWLAMFKIQISWNSAMRNDPIEKNKHSAEWSDSESTRWASLVIVPSVADPMGWCHESDDPLCRTKTNFSPLTFSRKTPRNRKIFWYNVKDIWQSDARISTFHTGNQATIQERAK
jgi:hypothetical protein